MFMILQVIPGHIFKQMVVIRGDRSIRWSQSVQTCMCWEDLLVLKHNRSLEMDTITETWSAGVPMQKSRVSFAAAAINGAIYVAEVFRTLGLPPI